MARYSSDNFNTLSGTNIAVTGSVTAATKRLSPVGTGSPTVWGRITQAGSNGTDAGSKVWVSYGTAFSAAPFVNATHGETSEVFNVAVGSVGAGSFYIETDTASQSFSWTAIGPE